MRAAAEHLQVGSKTPMLDQVIRRQRLDAVLPPRSVDYAMQIPCRGPHGVAPAPHTEQQKLVATPEILPQSGPPFLHPDHVGLVLEAQSLHQPQPLREKVVCNPHIEVRIGRWSPHPRLVDDPRHLHSLHQRVVPIRAALDLPAPSLIPRRVHQDRGEGAGLAAAQLNTQIRAPPR